jgi:hypothetical protein
MRLASQKPANEKKTLTSPIATPSAWPRDSGYDSLVGL